MAQLHGVLNSRGTRSDLGAVNLSAGLGPQGAELGRKMPDAAASSLPARRGREAAGGTPGPEEKAGLKSQSDDGG